MILLVHAHPDPKSLTSSIALRMAESLTGNGADVRSVDLYHMENGRHFPPVPDMEELKRKTSLDTEVQRQMALVEQAEGYVIVHPDWWGGPPAVLKGWVDRVLRPGTAYEIPEGFGHRDPEGLLEGRRALVVVSGDAERPGPLDDFWITRVWGFCGVETRLDYLPSVRDSSLRERESFIRQVCGKAVDFILKHD